MRRLTAVLVLALSLVAAAPATGKGVRSVEVCGASECRTLTHLAERGHEPSAWVFGGASVGAGLDRPSEPIRSWRASIGVMTGEGGHDTELLHQIVVPGQGFLRRDGQWQRMSAEAANRWAATTRGIAPLPAREHPSDAVGEDDPATGPVAADSAVWPWIAAAALGLAAFLSLRHRLGGR
jgi:hypothetical protein